MGREDPRPPQAGGTLAQEEHSDRLWWRDLRGISGRRGRGLDGNGHSTRVRRGDGSEYRRARRCIRLPGLGLRLRTPALLHHLEQRGHLSPPPLPVHVFAESLADNAPLGADDRGGRSPTSGSRRSRPSTRRDGGSTSAPPTSTRAARRSGTWARLAVRNTPEDREAHSRHPPRDHGDPGVLPAGPDPGHGGRRAIRRAARRRQHQLGDVLRPTVRASRRLGRPCRRRGCTGPISTSSSRGNSTPIRCQLRRGTFRIAGNAISTVLYDQTRSDLHKLFLLSVLTGMNFNMTAIPKELAGLNRQHRLQSGRDDAHVRGRRRVGADQSAMASDTARLRTGRGCEVPFRYGIDRYWRPNTSWTAGR